MFNLIFRLFNNQIEAEVRRRLQLELEYRDSQTLKKLCFLGLILFKRSRKRTPGIKAIKNIIMDAKAIAIVDGVVLPAAINKELNK